MSEVDSDKLINHLKDKWGGANCPICKSGSWNVSDRVYELREYHGGNMVLGGGPIVPIVPVTCSNCGNTILVNSIVAGLTEQSKGEPNEQ
jgi:hypothetical protein